MATNEGRPPAYAPVQASAPVQYVQQPQGQQPVQYVQQGQQPVQYVQQNGQPVQYVVQPQGQVQQQVVVMQQPMPAQQVVVHTGRPMAMPQRSTLAMCPKCAQNVQTRVRPEPGLGTWL